MSCTAPTDSNSLHGYMRLDSAPSTPLSSFIAILTMQDFLWAAEELLTCSSWARCHQGIASDINVVGKRKVCLILTSSDRGLSLQLIFTSLLHSKAILPFPNHRRQLFTALLVPGRRYRVQRRPRISDLRLGSVSEARLLLSKPGSGIYRRRVTRISLHLANSVFYIQSVTHTLVMIREIHLSSFWTNWSLFGIHLDNEICAPNTPGETRSNRSRSVTPRTKSISYHPRGESRAPGFLLEFLHSSNRATKTTYSSSSLAINFYFQPNPWIFTPFYCIRSRLFSWHFKILSEYVEIGQPKNSLMAPPVTDVIPDKIPPGVDWLWQTYSSFCVLRSVCYQDLQIGSRQY